MTSKLTVTKRGALLVAGLSFILVYFAIAEPKWGLPFVSVNILVLVLFFLDYRTMPSSQALQIARSYDPVWQLRRQTVEIVLTNHGFSSISGVLRDTPPSDFGTAPLLTYNIAPAETIRLSYELTPNRRGAHEFGPVYAEMISRGGLTTKRWQAELLDKVDVIPDLEPLGYIRWLSRQRLLQDAEAKRRALGAGNDFVNVRRYAPGDEYRRINWWVTAKLNQLHTNNYDVEKNKTIWLILDAGRRMMVHTQGQPAFEHGISAVLALAQAAIEQGDQVGLLIIADQVLCAIPPQKGIMGMQSLLQGLSSAVAVRKETDFTLISRYLGSHLRRRSLVCIFSSLGEPQNGKLFVSALASIPKKHLTLFLSLEPQGAVFWANKRINNVGDAFNKGAAQIRRRQSQQAGMELMRSGMEVIRVPAGELALQGVLTYFQLRGRL